MGGMEWQLDADSVKMVGDTIRGEGTFEESKSIPFSQLSNC